MAGGSVLALMARPRLAIAAAAGMVPRTDAEWRAFLTPEQFAVLRQAQTEQPYSSPLTAEKRRGMYACGGCGQDIVSSQTKYNSRTGWPSFWRARPNAVREKRDRSEGLDRTKGEALSLGGTAALSYAPLAKPPEEARQVQDERKHTLDRLLIRLEEVGGAGEEIREEHKEVSEREAFLARELDDLAKSGDQL